MHLLIMAPASRLPEFAICALDFRSHRPGGRFEQWHFDTPGLSGFVRTGSGAKEPNLFGTAISNGLIRWQPRRCPRAARFAKCFSTCRLILLFPDAPLRRRRSTVSCCVKINQSHVPASVIIVTHEIQAPSLVRDVIKFTIPDLILENINRRN